ncbi:MAG: DEAD/DEAH box helicase family protein [Candidatus Dormiibacterota bacterium]
MSTDAVLAGAARRLRAQGQRQRWHGDPVGFARECVEWPQGSELTPYQAEALRGLVNKGRLAARSPHGSGKTATAALAMLWFAITREATGTDWKIVSTAGSWRQLERYLWPEVHLWLKRVRWDVLGLASWRPGRELFDLGLKLPHGQAFAGASDNPSLLEGAHADSILLVLDEAKSIPAGVFDAVEGALAGTGEAFALAFSTPGEPSGRFFEICSQKAGLSDWHPIHVTLEAAIAAGRISQEWAAQRAIQWGATSAVYLNRVRGEFASGDEDSVIPLGWVEDAFDRWRAWKASGAEAEGEVVIGVDVARFGTDQTAIVTRQGNVMTDLERHSLEDTMTTCGRVAAKLARPASKAVVDVIGVGGGVVDRLREQKLSVEAFNASEASSGSDRSGELGFLNMRSDAWWGLRDQLDPTYGPTICLLPDDQLLGDLCAPKWTITSAGKIQIESKEAIRKRLGRSTDAGDAVVQAFAPQRSSALEFLRQLEEQRAQRQVAPALAPAGLSFAGLPYSELPMSREQEQLLRLRGVEFVERPR